MTTAAEVSAKLIFVQKLCLYYEARKRAPLVAYVGPLFLEKLLEEFASRVTVTHDGRPATITHLFGIELVPIYCVHRAFLRFE